VLKIDLLYGILFAYKYQKKLRVLLKNAIVTSLPVFKGNPYFINIWVMHFSAKSGFFD